ncbi:MAG: DUF3488 domain-containing protein [Deltaproteobacteria bacterium]|nr:DUF3488 domain-containing protein [Deltaproteobacteria bacterium]
MNFQAYTLIITYFMAALGLSAVWLIEAIEAPFIIAVAAVVLLTLAFNIKRRRVIPGFLWNILAIFVFVFFIADYLMISGELITAASRFLTILLALKLFDLNRNRDHVMVFALVFFQILASAASTVSPFFMAILSLFIIGSIWALIIFNMKKDFQDASPKEGAFPGIAFGAPFFIGVIVISVFSILITFLLFLIIPRMEMGFFERKTMNTVKVTGFSDRVDLGAIGPVKQDATVIMRVGLSTKGMPKEPLYFRGMALDHYDGKGWSKTLRAQTLVRKDPGGVFDLGGMDGMPLEQSILLEPLDTEVIFAASNVAALEGPFPGLWLDASGSVRLPSPPYSRIEYRALSMLSPIRQDGGPPLPEYLDTSFLRTNPGDSRMERLAYLISNGLESEMEKASAIEKYLKTNYTYTLSPPQHDGAAGPLDNFLFYSKQGYCEHYATAMALLLRINGIPARVVTGFLQGDWNEHGNYFIVRQQDAHSWVEAYIKGEGWRRFDPTPSSGIMPHKPSALGLYLDLLKWRWNRYIIHFSFTDQRKLAVQIEGAGSGVFQNLRLYVKGTRSVGQAHTPRIFFIILAVSLGLILLWRIKGRSSAASRTPAFYIEMLKVLKKKGITKKADETPLEFAERTGNIRVKRVTEAFQLARYGGGAIRGKELDRIKAAIEELKRRA